MYEVPDFLDPMVIEVKNNGVITATSKVIVYLPGTTGFPKDKGLPPTGCIEVFIECGGKGATQGGNASSFRRKMPDSLIKTLGIVRACADSADTLQKNPIATRPPRRSVAIFCFSRGAAWGLQICNNHGSLIDYAWIFAGFPSTKDQWYAKIEAIATMQLDTPVVIVQFKKDYWCNIENYPTWYAAFQGGMSAPASTVPSTLPGHRREHFFFFRLAWRPRHRRDVLGQ